MSPAWWWWRRLSTPSSIGSRLAAATVSALQQQGDLAAMRILAEWTDKGQAGGWTADS